MCEAHGVAPEVQTMGKIKQTAELQRSGHV